MKAIIPVAGAGTKLRPLTYTQPKALIPMAGKTILNVIIDELSKWDIDEFIFVIGYLGEKIQDYVMKNYPDLKCSFINQSERKGTAHAIWLTKNAVNNEPVAIVYGDTLCSFDVKEVMDDPHSMIGVKRVEDPRLFGVAEIDKNNMLTKVYEKPKIPKSNYALVGIYKIMESKEMYEALDDYLQTESIAEGEYHFTFALQKMIENGIQLKAFEVKNWFDCGKKEALLDTNAILLKRKYRDEQVEDQYFEHAVIVPPVHIGSNCQLENAIVGPNVTIGDNTIIRDSIVSNSIIGSFAELHEIVLKSSIIGNDAFVHGLSQSLNIGDNTEIDLG